MISKELKQVKNRCNEFISLINKIEYRYLSEGMQEDYIRIHKRRLMEALEDI